MEFSKFVKLTGLLKALKADGLDFDSDTLKRHVEMALMAVADRQRRLQNSRPKTYTDLGRVSRPVRELLKNSAMFMFKGEKWYISASERAMRGWQTLYMPTTVPGVPEDRAAQAGAFIDGMKEFPGVRIQMSDFMEKLPKRLPVLNGGGKYCMFEGYRPESAVRFEREAKANFFLTIDFVRNLALFDKESSIYVTEVSQALMFHDTHRFVVVRTHDAPTF